MKTILCLLLPVLVLFTGCASSKPKDIQGLESSPKLQPNEEFPHSLIYKKEGVDYKQYTKFIIDPAAIYQGEDAQFKKVSDADKQAVADFVEKEFKRVLGQRYAVVDQAGPGVLRMKFTVAGIQSTQPALATVSHLMPIGMALNLGKSAAGMKGSFMGSVTLAGELYDSQDNTMVAAFLTSRSPNAMDLTTTFTGLQAAKTAVTEIADRFCDALDRIQGKSTRK
jgi:hypothetical protein